MRSKFFVYVHNPPFNIFQQDYFKGLSREEIIKTYYLSKHGIIESKRDKFFDKSYILPSIQYKTLYLMDRNNKEIAYIIQKIEQKHNQVYNIPVDHIEMKCTEIIYKQTFFNIIERTEVVQEKIFHRIFIELNCELNEYVLNELRKVLLLFHAP